MKKRMRILLTSLIISKVVIVSVFLYQIEAVPMFTESVAVASENQIDIDNSKSIDENRAVEQAPLPAKGMKSSADGTAEATDIALLKKMESELKEKERFLEKKEKNLEFLQSDITGKIENLTHLRDEIRAEIAKKEADEERKFKHLIKIYSTMKPARAAGLIDKLDLNFAIELLAEMRGDTVGSILSFVNVEKAAQISEGLLKK